jgi:hypothetical protein
VKTTERGGVSGSIGYDAGKKIKGRKRHLLVDTMGLIWAIVVHRAGIQDRDGARLQPQRGWEEPALMEHLNKLWAGAPWAEWLLRHAGDVGDGALRLRPGNRTAFGRCEGLCGAAAPLGPRGRPRANLGMAEPLTPAFQGLRVATRCE